VGENTSKTEKGKSSFRKPPETKSPPARRGESGSGETSQKAGSGAAGRVLGGHVSKFRLTWVGNPGGGGGLARGGRTRATNIQRRRTCAAGERRGKEEVCCEVPKLNGSEFSRGEGKKKKKKKKEKRGDRKAEPQLRKKDFLGEEGPSGSAAEYWNATRHISSFWA